MSRTKLGPQYTTIVHLDHIHFFRVQLMLIRLMPYSRRPRVGTEKCWPIFPLSSRSGSLSIRHSQTQNMQPLPSHDSTGSCGSARRRDRSKIRTCRPIVCPLSLGTAPLLYIILRGVVWSDSTVGVHFAVRKISEATHQGQDVCHRVALEMQSLRGTSAPRR